jgi:hypothetical protein
MLADGAERATKIEQFSSIQVEQFNRGSASGSESDDGLKIPAPFEVLRPSLAARIEKPHQTICPGIAGVGFVRLVPIATWTGPGKFRCCITRATRMWQNMLAGIRRG